MSRFYPFVSLVFMLLSFSGFTQRKEVLTVPVVFHVVWHTDNDLMGITELQQLLEQVNQRFLYPEQFAQAIRPPFRSAMGRPNIQFLMAGVSPDGVEQPGTTFTYTSRMGFHPDSLMQVKFDSLGGRSSWDVNAYLNIWIAPIQLSQHHEQTTGFSTRPGYAIDQPFDGIVLDNDSPDLVQTLVHEIGHYLGLSHPWGDIPGLGCQGDDHLEDTPGTDGPSMCGQRSSRCSDMVQWENYMDYNDCGALFTREQSLLMQQTLLQKRKSLLKRNTKRTKWINEVSPDFGTGYTSITAGYWLESLLMGSRAYSFEGGDYYRELTGLRKRLAITIHPVQKCKVVIEERDKNGRVLASLSKFCLPQDYVIQLPTSLAKNKKGSYRIIVTNDRNTKEIPDYGQVIIINK